MANELETIPCSACGIRFGMPHDFVEARRGDKRQFYCPNGHILSYHESEADRLRRERDRLKQNQARLEELFNREHEARQAAERRISAAKGQITKLKTRAAAGVCPCCNRTVSQMARHMKSKHPEFKAEGVVDFAAARDQRDAK